MTEMMSIRQLVYYRVLMFGLKALWNNEPVAMSGWRESKVRRLKITSRSFRFVFGKLMSKIPDNFKIGDPLKKKKAIKDWVFQNIPWNEKWTGLNGEYPHSEDSESE